VVALLDDADANSPLPISMQPIGYFPQNPSSANQDLPVNTNNFDFAITLSGCLLGFSLSRREPADSVGGWGDAAGGTAVRIFWRKVRAAPRLEANRPSERHGRPFARRCCLRVQVNRKTKFHFFYFVLHLARQALQV